MKAIMYHYVRPPEREMPHLRFLDVENFRKQLEHLKATIGFVDKALFESLSVGENVDFPSGAVLTFDDGLKDHIKWVLPILKEKGLWGFFFIPTGHYATQKLLGVHRIHYLLSRISADQLLKDLEPLIRPDMFLKTERNRFQEVTYLRQSNPDDVVLFKKMMNYYIAYEFRDLLLDQLMLKHCPDETKLHAHYYLSEDEIRSLQNEGMVVGSHTVSHRVMSKISLEEQSQEVSESFHFLDGVTGGLKWKSFCYPYGGFHTFTEETEKLLTRSNSRISFNVEPRDILPSDMKRRPQALPRYDCNQFAFGSAS